MSSPDSPSPDRVDAESGESSAGDLGEDSAADLVAARRVLVLAGVALIAVVVCIVLVLTGQRGDVGGDTIEAGPVASESIGPGIGVDVADYLTTRTDALAAARGDRVAVVSLTGYVTVEAIDEVMGAVDRDSTFMGPLLIAPVGASSVQTTDVDETVEAIRSEAEAQLAEIEVLAPTVVDDPEFAAFYAAEIERYRVLLGAIGRSDVVFGFVVSAPVEVLTRLAAHPQVRLVDVGTGDGLAQGTLLRGLRPEEVVTAGTPETRP